MKLNISIDDVSPHPKSSTRVLEQCSKIISFFPDAKFSIFVPLAYWRTVKPEIATSQPLRIDAFPDFCETLSSLPESNFEICYHGLFHGIPGRSDNDEFQHLSYDEALEKIGQMEKIAELANLKNRFKKIFRPPAWRMSPGAFEALRKSGFEVLALSPKEYAQKTYAGAQNKTKDVVYYNCNPPFDPLSMHEKTEIVYHACEWDKNYLSEKQTEELVYFLSQNRDKFEFAFLKELL